MRHSTIELTMSVYTHPLAEQEAEAVGKLPDFGEGDSAARRAEATG